MANHPSDVPPDGAEPRGPHINPDRTDVATAKERPKLRTREDPHPALKDWAPGAEKRMRTRPVPPTFILEPAGLDQEHWTAQHNDPRIHDLQLAEAFGTRSYAVMWAFMEQLQALCPDKWWDEDARQWRMNEVTFNAVLAMVNSVKPRNEMEAALAAQMTAVHLLTMKVTTYALKYHHEQ